MRALSAYVGASPRRVKRLVNTYRMIKARLSPAQLASFLTDRETDGVIRSGPYQIVIALLVIGTGAPVTGAQILRALSKRDPRDPVEKAVQELRALKDSESLLAAQVIEVVVRTQQAKTVRELRGWASQVERYLLQRAGSTS